MGDGGGDSGSYGDYIGDGGGCTSSHTTSKEPSKGEKNLAFLAMGVMSAMLVFTSAQIVGNHIDYSKSTIESCIQSTYSVKNDTVPSLLNKVKNLFCEPVITSYVGNERNPNYVKDSDLKSETVDRIDELRRLYIPHRSESALKNN